MGRSALDMQHDGTEKLRRILATIFPPQRPTYEGPVTKRENVHLGDSFIVTLDDYDYEVTVKFEDPR